LRGFCYYYSCFNVGFWGKSFKKTRVKVGIVNSEWVEILEGLDEKDNVAVEGAYSLYYKQYAETTKVED